MIDEDTFQKLTSDVIGELKERISELEKNIKTAWLQILADGVNIDKLNEEKDEEYCELNNEIVKINKEIAELRDKQNRDFSKLANKLNEVGFDGFLGSNEARKKYLEASGCDYKGMITGEQQIAMEQEQGEKPPEPKPGEHFIMRDDNTPNNPILRALFFGGDEEYIVDWKFRYKRPYYEIVKREDLQFLINGYDTEYSLSKTDNLDRIKEEYNL